MSTHHMGKQYKTINVLTMACRGMLINSWRHYRRSFQPAGIFKQQVWRLNEQNAQIWAANKRRQQNLES